MNFEVSINGLSSLMERLTAMGANIQPLMNAALAKSATKAQEIIRLNTPVKTGNLARSVLTEMGDNFSRVSVNEQYGMYVEMGTSAHDIVPKNKKALYWKGAAYPVKIVHHPGTRANPFFERGLEESKPFIQETFQEMANVLTSEVNE